MTVQASDVVFNPYDYDFHEDPYPYYKRLRDDETGPNTGGMGAYMPVPWFDDAALDDAAASVFEPVAWQMARDGVPYRGGKNSGEATVASVILVHVLCIRHQFQDENMVLRIVSVIAGQVVLQSIVSRVYLKKLVDVRLMGDRCNSIWADPLLE